MPCAYVCWHLQVCMIACMYVHPFERMNRVGTPSSIRDSQQPFLVLDGAVRMHRLAPSASGAQGMHSSIREWKDETWEVSSSIRTDRSAQRKVLLNIQNLTVRVSGLGHGVRTLWAISCVSHAKAPKQEYNRTERGVHNLAFCKKHNPTEVGKSAGSYLLKMTGKISLMPYVLSSAFCWHWHTRVKAILAPGYILCHVLRREQTCLSHEKPNNCKRMPLKTNWFLLCLLSLCVAYYTALFQQIVRNQIRPVCFHTTGF